MLSTLSGPTTADLLAKPIRVKSGITHVTYSRDGRLLATSDAYMRVRIYEESILLSDLDFNVIDDRVRSIQRIRGLAFSDDCQRLFVAAADSLLSVDCRTGETVWSYSPPRSFGFLIISPIGLAVRDGLLAATFDNGSIGVWTQDGELHALWKHNDAPRQLAFGPNSNTLVGSDSFSLTRWDWWEKRCLERCRLRERAYAIAPSRISDRIAIWTLNKVQVFDGEPMTLIDEYPTGLGLPVVALNPVDDSLAVAERTGVRLYDTDGRERDSFPVDVKAILSLGFDPAGDRLAIGCSDASYRVWSIGS